MPARIAAPTRRTSMPTNSRKTPSASAPTSEARARERGGRRLPGGTIPPDAAKALTRLLATGYAESATACIARALVQADKGARS